MTTVPDISFDGTTPDQIVADVVAAQEASLGRTLAPADPQQLSSRSFAAILVLLRNYLDREASQCFLEYAEGTNLDALGALVGVTRQSAVAATCTIRFSTAAPAAADITIPAGTRVAPSSDLYFATDEAATLLTGNSYVDVPATCQATGDAGNGYTAGQIDRIVDPVAGIATAANTTTSANGVDTETDASLRERIRLAPTAFSVAGPRDAYEFWARSASASIIDVYVDGPDDRVARSESARPGEVDIYVLLAGGTLPDAAMLALVEAECTADERRPLTDLVTACAPTTVTYGVNLTYYVSESDAGREAEIDAAVIQAVTDWMLWTRSAIGRDVNPSELTARILAAGAKRVAITTPVFNAIDPTEIGVLTGSATIVDGGLEAE